MCLREFIRKIIYEDYADGKWGRWRRAELLRFYYIVNHDHFLEKDKLLNIFEYAETDVATPNYSIKYLSFVIWNELFNVNISKERSVEVLISDIWRQISERKNKFPHSYNMIQELINSYKVRDRDTIYTAYSELVFFFMEKESDGDHSPLELELINLSSQLNRKIEMLDFKNFEINFESVLNTIDGKIRNQIGKFNQDKLLEKNFPALFGFFFANPESFIKTYDDVRRDYEILKANMKYPDVDTHKDKLRASLNQLKRIISPESDFAQHFRDYKRFNVHETWQRVIAESKDKIAQSNITMQAESVMDIQACALNILDGWLSMFFSELINNLCKHGQDATCKYKINIEDQWVIFTLEQNKPFKNNHDTDRLGGLKFWEGIIGQLEGSVTVINKETSPTIFLRLPTAPKMANS